MRIQFASDLHLDAWPQTTFDETLEPSAPILALCGDVASLEWPALSRFFEWCSERWETVFWILGAAESGWSATALREASAIVAPFKNVEVVQHAKFASTDGYLVVFLTYGMFPQEDAHLWHDGLKQWVEPELTPLPPKQMRAWWHSELSWVREATAHVRQPVVVFSHFPPAPWLSQERFVAAPEHSVRSADEERLMESSIVAWVCGHTHKTVEFHKLWTDAEGQPHNMLLVTNPRGFPTQNFEYRRDAVLRLPPRR
jgi:Calcineurin-like phosphoesterase